MTSINEAMRVCVISHARPRNVGPMQALLAPFKVYWYVGTGEDTTYANAGAHFVKESGGLCESRNQALDDAFEEGRPCIQVSDDLKGVKVRSGIGAQAWTFEHVYRRFNVGFFEGNERAHLQGVAPTSNPYFVHKTFTFDGFVVGDLIAVKPCDLRFDTGLKLKEDYDYTLQHLERFRRVIRHNDILCEFAHRTNKGGAVDFRTAEREQEAIAFLKKKWPRFIADNARRPNEILMRWKDSSAPPKFLRGEI